MKKEIKLLVFDWDGTLMDSEARIVECIQRAAADLGYEVPDPDSARNIIGLGLREAVAALFPESDDELLQGMVTRYRHHFLDPQREPTDLFPAARETLDWASEEGFLLAIATGKGRGGLDAALQRTGLDGTFHASRCSDECFSKPHPQMLEQLMEVLGVGPCETLMIGDTEYDMAMARNAGVAGVAVTYGVHAAERLLAYEPVASLDCISELRCLLSGQSVRAAV
jgi:phosphoglycolate phosphatase